MKLSVNSHKGFTLLELMIAMALSTVLLGVLTAGMGAVIDEWQDSSDPLEERLESGLILLQLEQALLGSAPHSYIDQDTLDRNVYFMGESTSLSWVSSVSIQAKQEFTAWQIVEAEQEGVFLKTVSAFVDNPTERLENVTGTLILPEYELTLSYLALDDLDRPEWLEEWDSVEYQSLPMAVQVKIFNRDLSDEDQIEFVVPILHQQHDDIQPVDIL